MPRASRETEIYRQDAKFNHSLLTAAEREKLILPYLPQPPVRPSKQELHPSHISLQSRSKFGVRSFIQNQIHALLYATIHTIFSIYIRLRIFIHAVVDRIFAILYYHHRTPELIRKDAKDLSRIPGHVSVVLKLENGGRGGTGLETLVDEVAEITAWCSCVGIPNLSVYESTGILKGYIPATHRAITRKLTSYYGNKHPALNLRAPHIPSMESAPSTPSTESTGAVHGHVNVLLLSADDGRDSLVDLTKTLTEMSQRSKLASNDITIDLVDAEISESVMGEPDLLILFGPRIELSGYPPWQIRLTEIFNVQDNEGVGYQVFLRALYSYAKTQMRFGR